jgi:uncharacterized protein YbaA (DUF1428 family)
MVSSCPSRRRRWRPIAASRRRREEFIKAKPGETVVFAWIAYKSRAHRDRVNAKVMKDPRIASMDPKSMPFDARRMLYGGFEVLVEA